MKITAQEEYGLRCLLRLARANERLLPIREIAAAEGLSQPYVAKLLAVLRQKGLIKSARGLVGGYRLARPASEIGLGTILMSLGEPLYEDPGYCQKHAGTEAESGQCVHINGCTLRALWQTLEHWMRHLLDQISLADLMHSERDIGEMLRSRLDGALSEAPATLIPLGVVKEEKELA